MRTAHPVDERTLRVLAIAAGFGHSVDLVESEPGSKRESYYVAKYITKSGDSRHDVPWQHVDRSTGEVTHTAGRYRTWSMSRDWGLRMAQVRAEAAQYAAARRTAVEQAQDSESGGALASDVGGSAAGYSSGPPPAPA